MTRSSDGSLRQKPPFRTSDVWRAPLHDLPIRDELLYQYLPLRPDMRLLEIGPGSGFTAFRLSRCVNHLTLVDVARASADHLREVFRAVPNVTVVCADACQPGLSNAVGTAFDAVYALEVFEFLPDPRTCLSNLAQALRPGGSILLVFPNYPPPRNPGVTYFRTRAEFDGLMASAGLSNWEIYSLRLRPHASFITRNLHSRPIVLYRRLRRPRGVERPLTYEMTWAFQARHEWQRYKWLLHGAWTVLFAALRMGGACFERQLLDSEILNNNLLMVGRKPDQAT